ncbi:DoxX family protein [Flavobacterium sp. JP2137]|uniref:DoxX family protein n=1 Tax=Flavobacterium sp. JP2137 TaxID=3414510 RepID=UPI003D2FFC75
MKKNTDLGLFLIRIIIALTMLLHGINKIVHGLDFIKGVLTKHGLPTFLSYGVYIGEIAIPLLIIIGFRTRLASLCFALYCLVVILLSHIKEVLSLNENGGLAIELVAIYLLVGLGLYYTGGGKLAVSTKSNWD